MKVGPEVEGGGGDRDSIQEGIKGRTIEERVWREEEQ